MADLKEKKKNVLCTHFTAQREQGRYHLGEIFAFPQIDGLENVYVGDSVRFDGFLEPI